MPEEVEVINIAGLVLNRELREDAVVAFFEGHPELLEVTARDLNSRKFKKAQIADLLATLLGAVKKTRTRKPAPTPEVKAAPKAEIKPKAEVTTAAKPEPKVKAKVNLFPTFTEPVKEYLRKRTKVINGEVIITFPENDGQKVPPIWRIWEMLKKDGAKNGAFTYTMRGNIRIVIRKKKH